MLKSPFNKVAALKAGYFIKKDSNTGVLVNIVKFFRTPIFKNTYSVSKMIHKNNHLFLEYSEVALQRGSKRY